MIKALLLTATLAGLSSAKCACAVVPKATALCGNSTYSFASTLGPTIEGASVDASGNIYAVNKTHFMNLSSGQVLLTGNGGGGSHFASSRFIDNTTYLVGDAAAHQVQTAKNRTLFSEAAMLQPNDMTISEGGVIYLSGMNYTSNTGDLWYLPLNAEKPVNVPVSGSEKTFRFNGIELSPDDSKLYLTSAENNHNMSEVVSAKILRFSLEKGVPNPTPSIALDLQKAVRDLGIETALRNSTPPLTLTAMDPDGMRMDSCGKLFITLNAFGHVLVWDSNTGEVGSIKLPTVQNPSNLEFGGEDGKTLVIVGRCFGDLEKSCVDVFKNSAPGRAFRNLQLKGKPSP